MPGEGGTLGFDNSRSGVPLPVNQLPSNQLGYDAEYSRMEAWLDENQEFAQDYFIRKATRNNIDAWLVSHATPTTVANDILSSPSHATCSSRGGSGATTPVR